MVTSSCLHFFVLVWESPWLVPVDGLAFLTRNSYIINSCDVCLCHLLIKSSWILYTVISLCMGTSFFCIRYLYQHRSAFILPLHIFITRGLFFFICAFTAVVFFVCSIVQYLKHTTGATWSLRPLTSLTSYYTERTWHTAVFLIRQEASTYRRPYVQENWLTLRPLSSKTHVVVNITNTT